MPAAAQRSGMYRLLSATPGGDRRLTLVLDKTALLVEGSLVSLGKQSLKLDAHLLFARVLDGAHVTGPGFRARVASAEEDGTLTLTDVVREQGAEIAPGDLVRLWQCAVGDRLEAPLVLREPQEGEGLK